MLNKPPIYPLIDEYSEWKYARHPLQAGAHRSLLIRFAKSARLKRVEDIEEGHIAFFVGGELSEFYAAQAIKALRQFLWYSKQAGYDCIGHNTASKTSLQKASSPRTVASNVHEWKPGTVLRWKLKR